MSTAQLVASSASPELVHWHDETPDHLASGVLSTITGFAQAANEVLSTAEDGLREVLVTAEHTMEWVAEELGIAPFHHNFFGKLEGCLVRVGSDGYLEIHREGVSQPTRFQVQYK